MRCARRALIESPTLTGLRIDMPGSSEIDRPHRPRRPKRWKIQRFCTDDPTGIAQRHRPVTVIVVFRNGQPGCKSAPMGTIVYKASRVASGCPATGMYKVPSHRRIHRTDFRRSGGGKNARIQAKSKRRCGHRGITHCGHRGITLCGHRGITLCGIPLPDIRQ